MVSDLASASSANQRPLRWLLAVAIGLALASRLSYLLRPFDPDAAIFIYMGKLVAEGGVYWRDLVDNKLPTVGLLTSIFWRAFGDWWPGYVLVQTLLSLIAAAALGEAAGIARGRSAWWPTTLFAVVYLNLNRAVFGGFQLETLHVFFASLGAMSAMRLITRSTLPATGNRRRFEYPLHALTLGLCAGCAALAKPTGLSILAAGGLMMLLLRRPWRSIAVAWLGMIAGVAVVAGVVGIYLHQTGTLADLPDILAQLRLYTQNSATDYRDINKLIWVAVLIGFPILGRWKVGRRLTAGDGASPLIAPSPAVLFSVLWLMIELTGVLLQKRMYGYHFLVLAPPAALIFGLMDRPARARGMMLSLLPAMVISIIGIGQILWFRPLYPQRLESSDWLNAHAARHDRVWRDLTSRLLIETNLRPGSRYLLTFLFPNSDEAPQRYCEQIKSDFDRRRPRWIVLPNDIGEYTGIFTPITAELDRLPRRRANYIAAWRELERYVQQHYHPVAVLSRETIWEINAAQ